MLYFRSIVILTIVFNKIIAAICEPTLKQVHVLFRHGSRTVELWARYPNDPHFNETYYPYGFGQLTNKGKSKMFLLGKALRTRYDAFLGPLYTPAIVEPMSTHVNRTKMSLELVLAGLFPPKETVLEWQQELNWQPIPYNYVSSTSSRIFSFPLFHCPKYIQLIQAIDKTDTGIMLYKRYADLFHYVEKHTGLNNITFIKVINLYSTLKAQEDLGLRLPSWTKTVYPKELESAAVDYFIYLASTEELNQLAGGFLLKKIISDATTKLNYKLKPPGRKLFLYSVHDMNLVMLLSAMNVYFPHFPSYGAYILIEVHKIDNEVGIQIFYQNYSQEEPRRLIVPGCDPLCPLREFYSLLRNNLPTSDDQCEISSLAPTKELSIYFSFILVLLLNFWF